MSYLVFHVGRSVWATVVMVVLIQGPEPMLGCMCSNLNTSFRIGTGYWFSPKVQKTRKILKKPMPY